MTDQTARLDWRGGVPISTEFDDPYYSLDDGVAETRHVFLAGNELPQRFGGAFQIAELGFGTGLNLIVTWQAWIDAGRPGTLNFTSFEAHPMTAAQMAQALTPFETLTPLAEVLLTQWSPMGGTMRLDAGLTAEVVIGDARKTVPKWQGLADAWYLDGFSPAKNPALWDPDLMACVGQKTQPGGTAATYSAAGHVRQSLAEAGFHVTRIPGFGRKRHMTQAVKT